MRHFLSSGRWISHAGRAVGLMVVALLLTCTAEPSQAREAIQTFTLEDHLRFNWEHQLVTFPLDDAGIRAVNVVGYSALLPYTHLRLLNPQGQPIAFEPFRRDDKWFIAFFADVAPLKQVTYALVNADNDLAPTPASPMKVEVNDDVIRMSNANTGVLIAASLANARNGPLQQIMLADGKWAGSSTMPGDLTVSGYEAKITGNGPVFGEVTCTYTFEQGGTWTITFRLPADGKVVLVEEKLNGVTSEGSWKFSLDASVAPTHEIHRVGYDNKNKNATKDALVANDLIQASGKDGWQLKPWHDWWDNRNAVSYQLLRLPKGKDLVNFNDPKKFNDWYIVDQGQQPDDTWRQDTSKHTTASPVTSILVGAGLASQWADPGQKGPDHFIRISHNEAGDMTMRLPLGQWPGRRWFIGSEQSSQAFFDNFKLTPAHFLVLEYFDRPLNTVKDLVLSWPEKNPNGGSHIFPSAARLAELRKKNIEVPKVSYADRVMVKNFLLYPEKNASVPDQMMASMKEDKRYDIAGIILEATPTVGVGRNAAINSAQHQIGRFVESTAILADATLGNFNLPEEDRDVLRAQLALMGYAIGGDDMISTERRFNALQNMTAFMYGGLGMIACAIPDHPEAANWANRTATLYDGFLKSWTGPNGSWIEAPHYQVVSLASMIMFGVAAEQSGISDFIYDERLKKTVMYLAKLSTPPDPGFGNLRHYPPIGNTYLMERSNIFAIMAGIYEKKDPEYAQTLVWVWEQQGKPPSMGVGGDVNIHWIDVFLYGDAKAVEPKWTTDFYPSFGAVMRHGFATDHETYMVYHHGRFAGHYDFDQGSFEMWGKGQPLMLDWGYDSRMPAWKHNTATFTRSGKITHFDGRTWSDLIEAKQSNWHRDMLFVKDAASSGPAYFVIKDKALDNAPDKGALMYWFNTTQTPGRNGQTVRVVGPGGVDLDVWFDKDAAASLPMHDAKSWAIQLKKVKGEDPRINAEDAVKTTIATTTVHSGRLSNKDPQKRSTTQHGLKVPFGKNQTVLSVLYPRKDSEKPPVMTLLEGGRCLRVVSDAGTDYVFFGDEPMEVAIGKDVHFKGRVGVVQVRKDATYLTLHDGESIRAGSAKLLQSQGRELRVAH